MEYPNDFDVPSFSAGKTVAFSRSISVWLSIVFFLIIAACGFVLLGVHLKKNYPFVLSVDPITEEWVVITYPHEKQEKIQQYQIIQEKLVKDYVTNWFTLSENANTNEMRWKSCDVNKCNDPDQFQPDNINCVIACKSGSSLFEYFVRDVLPEYRTRTLNNGEQWSVGRMMITPQNKPSEKSSNWQVVADINSNISGTFTVLIFVKINRNVNMYPATFGYYIQDFNAYKYRIANE